MARHRVLYLPPPSHTQRVFRPETYEALLTEFQVTANDSPTNLTTEQVAERITGHEALITGWGSPQLDVAVFQSADKLSLIAHSAGSVKFLFPGDLIQRYVLPRRIEVFSANGAIALNVAEYTVCALIALSRRLPEHWNHFRHTGNWGHPVIPHTGQYLRGATVGLLGASKVGREVIKLLQPFDVSILVYDPYLNEQEAGKLGVRKTELNEAFEKADHVTIHLPATAQTHQLIGAEQLSRLRDGAVLVNTSRGWVLDEEALIAECRRRPLYVCLDVTDPEPPRERARALQELPSIYLTPHVSGAGTYGYERIGQATLQALQDHFAGRRPIAGAVDLSLYDQLA